MPGIPLQLDINERDLERSLSQAVVRQLNITLLAMSADGNLKLQLGEIIERQIKDTPEYDSLLGGELSAIFGLENPAPILASIIETVKNSMTVEIRPATYSSAGITAGITVNILIADFSDVLNVSGVSYDSEGGFVDWLRWLLMAGDSVVIVDYDVVFGSAFVGSRSDFAIMEKNIGKGFRVPPEFSGTVSNNWLTRAFLGAEEIVGNLLFVELNRRL